ncbi:hypothetical protein COEREDRAFT_48184 [Coemansia reversa NRRL 1564]|uniref:AA9 family lytic polysaccharide monooxygenase n=1 Tax=Coemansia reversa (strain ATCC 12441 / NRRL 1564) TaxID=763665 RepID=A0A2G5B521_COERN|nr:hypothetical protein COEREDRAFT_48184 [Coemansia reversa NRRL 1564]|eukprot:PIA13817.1 hypothetical protein COEREDRAFT_48184 [Coemansia reversa NRRL 1564]
MRIINFHSSRTACLIILLGWRFIHAHTYLTTLTIDGKELSEEQCIRPWWSDENYPVTDPNSKDMLCRTKDMSSSATKQCPVAAGTTITIKWTESGGNSRAISPSHLGPCLAYLAPMESNGEGNVWFKIHEDGYNADDDKWCVDRINANKGLWDIPIPADIKPGDYLLRTEVIALHEANRVFGEDKDAGAQYYPNCAQLTITGTGSAVPSGVAIPGLYKPDDPGILFNLWDGHKTYEIPGPPLYKSGGSVTSNNDNNAIGIADTQAQTPLPAESTTSTGRRCNRKGKKRKRGKRNLKRNKRKTKKRRARKLDVNY